jgi:hypothetical protein
MNFKTLTKAMFAGVLCLGMTAMANPTEFIENFDYQDGLFKDKNPINWSWKQDTEDLSTIVNQTLKLDTQSEEINYNFNPSGLTYENTTIEMTVEFVPGDSDQSTTDLTAWTGLYAKVSEDGLTTNLMVYTFGRDFGADPDNFGKNMWAVLVPNFALCGSPVAVKIESFIDHDKYVWFNYTIGSSVYAYTGANGWEGRWSSANRSAAAGAEKFTSVGFVGTGAVDSFSARTVAGDPGWNPTDPDVGSVIFGDGSGKVNSAGEYVSGWYDGANVDELPRIELTFGAIVWDGAYLTASFTTEGTITLPSKISVWLQVRTSLTGSTIDIPAFIEGVSDTGLGTFTGTVRTYEEVTDPNLFLLGVKTIDPEFWD